MAGELPSIPGVVPGLFDRPTGCLFSPRCRFATELCRDRAACRRSRALGDALCHYPLDRPACRRAMPGRRRGAAA